MLSEIHNSQQQGPNHRYQTGEDAFEITHITGLRISTPRIEECIPSPGVVWARVL